MTAPSVGVYASTAGDVAASRRMRDYMIPYFDYGDELRALARSGDHVWGGLALFRGGDDAAFDSAEIDYVGSLSATLAAGIRAGILARLGAIAVVDPTPGPVVMIVDAAGEITHRSPGADERLEALVSGGGAAAPDGVLGALVARARAWATGQAPAPPRIRVRGRSGEWQVLHAAPLASRDGHFGEVVITIETARPPEIVPLVVAAFDLTSRERDVTQLVLAGADTKTIAARLHLSTYTVQDHLKAIFDKADVRSRRELVAKVFFDCHAPNMGDEIAPSGWFGPA
jgi:DNA-binding CsgD family transcriptional regulator